ncbi:uncharacterized protein [Gossypium hirsutum]|uniref:DNA/RNA polymerases superfamily protein n=1 Tax=Gossypium hirsutum TaxID=3635 RepID=A0A1U8NJ45_GOSHI|nr:uncharacterized protein LOC107948058 [Gossypium hirsutum]
MGQGRGAPGRGTGITVVRQPALVYAARRREDGDTPDIITGPELVADTEEKLKLIRDWLKEVSDRKKSYAHLKRREIEYSMGDYVFLKVSPWKKILKFGQKDEEIKVRLDLTFEEEPMQILDREVKVLRKKSIPLVKVLWHNHSSEEATWEPEEAM